MNSSRRPAGSTRMSGRARNRARQSLDDFIDRELRRSGSVIVGIIVTAVAIVNLWQPAQIWFEQQARIAELDREVAAARATLAEAQADMMRWTDRAYVEAQARERLMFVYPGDISYLVVNDVNAKPTTTDEVPGTVQTTAIDWVDAFVQSYAFAASPDQKSK